MSVEIQVSSNIISGLDVLFVDLILVSLCNLVTTTLFNRLKKKKIFVNRMADELVSTSAGSLSVELFGYRRMAVVLTANSLFVIALATLTGFGIKGTDGINLEEPMVFLHAELSQQPLNMTDLDSLVVDGHSPDRKTLWGGVFLQRDECVQRNLSHVKIIRMATNVTTNDSSVEDGFWPPRSTNRTCLDPVHYVDAEYGGNTVADSVIYIRRRFEVDSIGGCHLFFEGSGETRELESARGNEITETFMQSTVLRACVADELRLESMCAKGIVTACITQFTTPADLDLVVLATWNVDQVVSESTAEWRNMVLTDVTDEDLNGVLSLTEDQQWKAAQMIAGRYATSLSEAIIAANSGLRRSVLQRRGESVSVTQLSLKLFFIPLGLMIIDIVLLCLVLILVMIHLRRHAVIGKVNVGSDGKELLGLLRETVSPQGTDDVELLIEASEEEDAESVFGKRLRFRSRIAAATTSHT